MGGAAEAIAVSAETVAAGLAHVRMPSSSASRPWGGFDIVATPATVSVHTCLFKREKGGASRESESQAEHSHCGVGQNAHPPGALLLRDFWQHLHHIGCGSRDESGAHAHMTCPSWISQLRCRPSSPGPPCGAADAGISCPNGTELSHDCARGGEAQRRVGG